MKQNKVIGLLSKFSPSYLRGMGVFLRSPIFNQSEKLIRLYDFLSNPPPESADDPMDEKAAFQVVYPEEDFNSNKLRILMTRLYESMLEFVSFQNYRETEGQQEVNLLKGMNQLSYAATFEKHYKKTRKLLQNSEGKNLSHYDLLHELESQLELFYLKQFPRGGKGNYEAQIRSMETSVLTRILKNSYQISNQNRIIGKGDLPEWIRLLVEQLDPAVLGEEPLPNLYYHLYFTLHYPDRSSHFDSLKALLMNHTSELAPEEVLDVYTGALNNFARRPERESEQHNQELFELYQSMYQVLIVQKGKTLLPLHMKNIVVLGIRAGQYEWVRSFISESAAHLDTDEIGKLIAVNYNLGVASFYEGDFEEAESALNRILPNLKDIFYELSVRAYLMMIYYETGDTIGSESLVHSFRMFLKRSKKISEIHKQNYLDFIGLYKQLFIIPPNDKTRLHELKAGIESLSQMVGRDWLLLKVEELLS